MRAGLQSVYPSKFHPSFVSGIYQPHASSLPFYHVTCFLQRKNQTYEFFRNEEIAQQIPNMSNGPVQEVCPKADTSRHKRSMLQYVGFGLKGCCSEWTGIGFQYFITSLSFLLFFFIKFAVIFLLWAFFFFIYHLKFRLLDTYWCAIWKLRFFCFANIFVMYKLTGKQ